MSTALDIQDLSIEYAGSGPVVKSLSFAIAAGESYGLAGESGCGKTTVAMAVARYLPQAGRITSGRLTVAGRDVYELDREELRQLRSSAMAMVYQDPGRALNPTMRVGQQLGEVFELAGHERDAVRTQTEETLRRVGFHTPAAIARRYPHELSGGQQQRVVIAMALAVRPALLILDEPTTGLDTRVQAGVLRLIEELRGELDAGVLLISHNLPLIAAHCDRVGVLYAGELVEEGEAASVVARPVHPHTQGLVRSLPSIDEAKGGRRLEAIPGSIASAALVPAGCTFAPRCALATDVCRRVAPELAPWSPGPGDIRAVRCHHTGETLPDSSALPATPVAVSQQDDAVLRVRGLTKRYGPVVACSSVDLDIGRGEVFGLVGESGSGKTTLGRCIVGLTGYEGELEVRGGAAQMVFQSPDASLNPRRTVGKVLARAIDQLGGTMSVRELAAQVGLGPELLDRLPRQLSGGQKQRVAIARAFAGPVSLVVCDEPVSALDVSVQAKILDLLHDLQVDRGVSYLFISHDLAVIRRLADRIGVMYRGQIVETGTAEEIFAGPRHPYTEAILRASIDDPRAGGGSSADERPVAATVDETSGEEPVGCRFSGLCPQAIAGVCAEQAPPWRELSPRHQIRCHLPVAELPRRQSPAPRGPS